MPEYKKPGWVVKNVLNGAIALAAKFGISLSGAQELAVQGRSSGAWRTTPVNPLTMDGARYLVAPRGETHWVRNLRAQGGGELRLGRKRDAIVVTELVDAEKPPILKAYLDRWGGITRTHFGASASPDQAELERLAGRSPVFRIR